MLCQPLLIKPLRSLGGGRRTALPIQSSWGKRETRTCKTFAAQGERIWFPSGYGHSRLRTWISNFANLICWTTWHCPNFYDKISHCYLLTRPRHPLQLYTILNSQHLTWFAFAWRASNHSVILSVEPEAIGTFWTHFKFKNVKISLLYNHFAIIVKQLRTHE